MPKPQRHRAFISAFMGGTIALAVAALAVPAAAEDPGQDDSMTRVVKCSDPYLTVEIYLPSKVIFKYPAPVNIPGHDFMLATLLSMPPTVGWYALDLSGAGKGKSLEPVRVSVAPDKKTIIVDQYTRGTANNRLAPTRVPAVGGTVQFDPKWATQVKCGPLLQQD